MDIINQTNRTILFDEINPNEVDLLTMLGDLDQAENLDDKKIEEINSRLLVHNFNEFMIKFHPVVHEIYDSAKREIRYFLKKPEGIPIKDIREIEINENNEFLNLLESLIHSHKSTKKFQPEYQFKYILDYLSPRKEIEHIKEKRNSLINLLLDYSRQKSEELRGRLLKEFEKSLEKLIRESNSIMVLLPIAMENIKLELMPKVLEKRSYDPITLGVLQMEERDLHILEAPDLGDFSVSVLGEREKALLKEKISEYMKMNSVFSNPEIKEIFYCFFGFIQKKDKFDLNDNVKRYHSYLELYKQSKEEYVVIVKPLMEKILGIKLFFNQYPLIDKENDESPTNNSTLARKQYGTSEHTEKGMGMSLIVTNVKSSKWLKADYKTRLQAYLATVNTKIAYENTIWFAILPPFPSLSEKPVDIRRERFKGNKKEEREKKNIVEETICIMELLSQYSIHAFFSPEATKETTFSFIGENGMDGIIEICKPFMKRDFSRYMIPCFPNFTIIPKDHSYVIIDRKLSITENETVCYSENKEDIVKLWMGGIYVEACYIAAGLTAAYQCPTYLKNCFGKNVSEEFPGVHYNIEESNNADYTLTTLAKETSGSKAEVLEAIYTKRFGYMFSSEKNSCISVFHARTLGVRKEDYECLYESLVVTYIIRILQFETFDFRKDEIKRFFQNNPESRRGKWLNGRRFINPILGSDDNLIYHIDEEKAHLLNEIELCRFRLQSGFHLRNEYKDFFDRSTEFDTINIIHCPFSSYGESSISPEILIHFANDMRKCKDIDTLDLLFCMNVYQANGMALNKQMILTYINAKCGEEREKYSNEDIYFYLSTILKETSSIGHGNIQGHHGARKVLLD